MKFVAIINYDCETECAEEAETELLNVFDSIDWGQNIFTIEEVTAENCKINLLE